MKIYDIPHCHHKHVAKQRFHGYSVSKLDNNWKVLIWHVEEVAFLLTASMIGTLELLQWSKHEAITPTSNLHTCDLQKHSITNNIAIERTSNIHKAVPCHLSHSRTAGTPFHFTLSEIAQSLVNPPQCVSSACLSLMYYIFKKLLTLIGSICQHNIFASTCKSVPELKLSYNICSM